MVCNVCNKDCKTVDNVYIDLYDCCYTCYREKLRNDSWLPNKDVFEIIDQWEG
jgi:hypothetical protein